MAYASYLHPQFGFTIHTVKYTESASESAFHFFILVSDPVLFERYGIRVATFTFAKTDFRLEQPVVRYGNTAPQVKLPVREFEEAIVKAIRANESVHTVKPGRLEDLLKQSRLKIEPEFN